MAATQQEKEKANWNDAETKAFPAYLYEHKSEIGDSGTFKAKTYNAAVVHIRDLLTQDPVKDGKMCKFKWQMVQGSLGTIFAWLIPTFSSIMLMVPIL